MKVGSGVISPMAYFEPAALGRNAPGSQLGVPPSRNHKLWAPLVFEEAEEAARVLREVSATKPVNEVKP